MTEYLPPTSLKALVIEDDPRLSAVFSQALQAAGFETDLALEGNQALFQLATNTPDIIVLDLHLPQVSGEAILRHIRATQRLANIPIMLTTADALMAERLRLDVDLVLLKPISFGQLRDLANRLKPIIELRQPHHASY